MSDSPTRTDAIQVTGDSAAGELVERLRALGPPTLSVAGRSGFTEEEVAAAAESRFLIYTTMVPLVPPVDWTMNPAEQRSFQHQLHTLNFLGVLYRRYMRMEDRDALRRAIDLALDWIASNPYQGSDPADAPWSDMVVGVRAPYLAYGLRAAACEGLIGEPEARQIVASLREHGAYLSDDANYAHGHNHGLFQDDGLLALCASIEGCVEEARGWRDVAARRALDTITQTVEPTEAVHLEHSTAYHFAMVNLINRLIAGGRMEDPVLLDIRERMVQVAGWFVMPDGTVPQFGDTNQIDASHWSREAAAAAYGTKLFERTGYAVVRHPDSYLAQIASFHSPAHKQADELSFVLFDHGRLMVGDAGTWSYDEGHPLRIYARSSEAHNVLLVDGQTFGWRRSTPYGGAIDAVGEGDGWHAILAHNPLLEQQGVRHQRILLWRPGVTLITLDRVYSAERHTYTRRMHLGPTIEVEPWAGSLRLTADGFAGELRDWSDVAVKTTTVKARDQPTPGGWTFPSPQARIPAWTVSFESEGSDSLLISALSAAEPPVRIASAYFDGGSAEVRLLLGAHARTVRLMQRGHRLEVGEAAW
jgi:Heparinase II/III-like protein/Heparinase II/III N-terminus